jgi:PAS domain S-box-containing protein
MGLLSHIFSSEYNNLGDQGETVMTWQYTPYVIPVIAGAAISASLALWGWRRRRAPGAVWFAALMAALAWWSAAYALEVMGTNVSAMFFATELEYVGIAPAPVAWLLMALAYTGQQQWLKRRTILLLFIIPAVTLVMTWTNPLHHLMYTTITLNTGGPFVTATYGQGTWFWVNIGYAYAMLLSGALLLVRALVRAPSVYRRQAALLLVGSVPSWVVNALYVFGVSPSHLDLTPFAFIVAGLVAAWALVRWGLFDIVPVARAAIIENLDSGIIVLDRQNRVVDINPVAQRIVRRAAPEAIGRPAAEVLAGYADEMDQAEPLKGIHKEILVAGDRGQRHFDLRVSPLKDQRGDLAGHLLVFRDVTEYKQVEQEMLDRRRTLHLVISAMPNVLLFASDENRLSAVFIPPGFPHIWRQSDLFGELLLSDVLPDEIIEDVEALLASVRESGGVQTTQVTLARGDEMLWFEVKASPIKASHDVLVVMDNITARKQAEAERERLIEDLDAFAHTVAHDLKNPLFSVIGYAEILEMTLGGKLSEEAVGCLQSILNGTRKMHSIIDSLLMLASVRKLEDIETSPIDLAVIVTEVRHSMAQLVVEYGAEIVAPESWPVALGHKQWVEEVLGNYVSNAIKYGGRPPRVELGSTLQADGKVRFWVRDNGQGITPEEQAKLFTPLTRLGRTDVEGHGLGLSIVRRIVEKLGGEVGVESEVGKGSTFFFTLPAVEEKVETL